MTDACKSPSQAPVSDMLADAARAQTAALRAMSVEQKLRVAESLRSFAWELSRAAIARRHPELPNAEVLRRVRAAFGHDRA
jgi:hypothetical protein